MRHEKTRNNLEEYLFGDLELPQDPPNLSYLMTITVRRRRFMQQEPQSTPQQALKR